MATLAVVSASSAPVAAPAVEVMPSGLTLYTLEDQLAALADTAEMVPPDQEQEFLKEFQSALVAAVEKRDRVGQFMAHLEQQVAFAKAEIERLKGRKDFYESVLERMEQYVIRVLTSLGWDARGKPRKLEGQTVTFSLKGCPASVDITDEAAVPGEYKSATITLPLPLWEELLDSLDLEFSGKIMDSIKKPQIVTSKSAIRAALEAGTAVPGARLITDKKSLVRR